MTEWGIFNDDSADFTAEEAVEAGMYSEAEALAALQQYADTGEEEGLYVHECEESDEDDEDEEDEE